MRLKRILFLSFALLLVSSVLSRPEKDRNRLRRDRGIPNEDDNSHSFGQYIEAHSFQKPLRAKTGQVLLTNWVHVGDTVIDPQQFVRLTAASKGKQGILYNTEPVTDRDWEVVVNLRIGAGSRTGGDGIGVWYVANPGKLGNLFGASDMFEGLGIFVDTYDNSGENGPPRIVIWNRTPNSPLYNQADNGRTGQIGGCPLVKQGSAPRSAWLYVKLKIVYLNGLLSVLFSTHNGRDKHDSNNASGAPNYEECAFGIPVSLPKGYHLMLSASTGVFYDNHDVFNVKYFRLDNVFPEAEVANIEIDEPSVDEDAQQAEAQEIFNQVNSLVEQGLTGGGYLEIISGLSEAIHQISHHTEDLIDVIQDLNNRITRGHLAEYRGPNLDYITNAQKELQQAVSDFLANPPQINNNNNNMAPRTIDLGNTQLGTDLAELSRGMRDFSSVLRVQSNSGDPVEQFQRWDTDIRSLDRGLMELTQNSISISRATDTLHNTISRFSGWTTGHFVLLAECLAVLGFFLYRWKGTSKRKQNYSSLY